MDSFSLIAQGAEARVYECTFLGRPCIVKERFPKSYRHPLLDGRLTLKRVVQEVRCLLRCGRYGVTTPCVYLVDEKSHRIYMEKVLGRTVKSFLLEHYDKEARSYSDEARELVKDLGTTIARIHEADMVHGDLTTSNFMVSSITGEQGSPRRLDLVVIDFGLGYQNPLPEDKAVDLYVLERAFVSTHPDSQRLVDAVLDAYKATSQHADAVLKRLQDVRRRGRKRDMFG